MAEREFRLIDANLNRCREGLRVVEDVARFVLDDGPLAFRLKTLRHEIAQVFSPQMLELLEARNAREDYGAFASAADEGQRESMVAIVVANAKRVQESLRVLEEWAKLPYVLPLSDPLLFQRARFALYEAERELTSHLLRKDKLEKLRGLYVIIDPAFLGSRTETWAAQEAIKGGANAIQLRDKTREKGALLEVALGLRELCTQLGALFIVNDDPGLALASRADGVHLGQKDLPVAAARRILRPDQIIGCSTATPEEAQRAQAEGADYIGVGSTFPTQSKSDTRPAGLETIRQVRSLVSIPIVAIGGINHNNVTEVIAAGADAVAVISAVIGAEDIQGSAQLMTKKISESRGKA